MGSENGSKPPETGDDAGAGRKFYAGLLGALIRVMGLAKGYLFLHGPRTALLSARLARAMDRDDEEVGRIFLSALLCDVGMVGLAEEAWENPAEVLPPEARREVNRHPQRSSAIVRAIPYLESLSPAVEHHHEWWNGSGYPAGLEGEAIPLEARILRLADTVTALGEHRPQRDPLTPVEIRGVVRASVRREFGPDLVGAFLEAVEVASVREFDRDAYHELREWAIDTVLPDEVPPLPARQLLEIFGSLIDAKDPYTGGHSRRVAVLVRALARIVGSDEVRQGDALAAGHLHDVGKVSVRRRVLAKEGRLDGKEWSEVTSHVRVGARILDGIPSMRHLAPGCRYHHERWDGGGYEDGLRGEEIPLLARMLAVCDAYDAMTSSRAYRPARSHDAAMTEIADSRRSHFGPEVAEAFLELPRELFTALRKGPPRTAPAAAG